MQDAWLHYLQHLNIHDTPVKFQTVPCIALMLLTCLFKPMKVHKSGVVVSVPARVPRQP